MRSIILFVSAVCGACFAATCAVAQSGGWGQAEDQIPPYHTHVDRHLGQDHVYPDRGAVLRDLPRGAIAVNYAGVSYRFAGGVWYEPLGPVFAVVSPPIGLVVPQLPPFAMTFDRGGKTYLYANDVFYRPRPDLGGYEVVNDPVDTAPQRLETRVTASPAAASPVVTPPVVAPPAATPAPLPVASPQPSVAQATPGSVSPAPPSAVAAPQIPASGQPPAVQATPAQALPVQAKSAVAPPVTPAAVASSVVTTQANPTRVIIYPHNGQSTNQQASDRYECYRFAVAQSGFDPLASNSGGLSAGAAQSSAEYSRAQAACLEGRGYVVQ